MEPYYKQDLSTDEILTIAGLLHFDSVLAIEINNQEDWYLNCEKHIRENISLLERNKVIQYEFHGSLLINQDIKNLIEIICTPERVIAIDSVGKLKKREIKYIAVKEKKAVIYGKNRKGGYSFNCYESFDEKDFYLGLFETDGCDSVSLTIEKENALTIKRKLANFQKDEALEYTLKEFDKAKADIILKVLSGYENYIRIQGYQKNRHYMKNVVNLFVLNIANQAVNVWINEDDNIVIESISVDEIISILLG